MLLSAFLIGSTLYTPPQSRPNNYVAYVRVAGLIFADNDFSLEELRPILQHAFSDKKAKGVVLEINSGGGSPVQSAMLYHQIQRLKKKYHKKVVVLGDDLLASGAYMVAMGADKVYVHPDTITGSIGVAMESFGFSEAIKKIGITRRILTAGENKASMDPFTPTQPQDVKKMQGLLNQVHQHFIGIVKKSRGKRLKATDATLFSGDFWIGTKAKQLGLVDDVAYLDEVLQREFSVTQYVDYSQRPNIIEYLSKGMGSLLELSLHAKQTAHLQEML